MAVKVRCGPNELEASLDGRSVSSLRQSLASVLNIAPDAWAYVNSELVADEHEHIVTAGSSVEFIKAAGQKG